MKLYTEKQLRELIKSFEDYYEVKHGVTPCDFMLPRIDPLEVELLGRVKDEQNQSPKHD